jgi:hypothetical protein
VGLESGPDFYHGEIDMKVHIVILLILIPVLTSAAAAQTSGSDEAVVRDLEQQQVVLLLKGDVKQMAVAWLPEFTVNNPFNDVVNGHSGPVRKGHLTYSAFERNIEKIVFRDGLAVVMGSETVVPNGASRDAGKEIHRRFTDLWVKVDGKWKMLARHANVVCGN